MDGGAGKRKETLWFSLGAEQFIDDISAQNIPAEALRIMTRGARVVVVFTTSNCVVSVAIWMDGSRN